MVMVIARAGRSVRLYDTQEEALSGATEAIYMSLHDLQCAGLVKDPEVILAGIQVEPNLALVVGGAGYVQECGPENLEMKQAIYSRLEGATAPDTVLASSTSGITASRFTGHLAHPEHCLVAHPVNSPLSCSYRRGGAFTDD
ncbi:3-hydroxyacyl-CoA dehydrogenase NAD-binding domain-containing protein [Billgrantia endophytica]|uniref:3-hydroxyacyl-CoA dehydrogenase NAD-binding domain-containing protein n=1 Tax=Billgrantia endophytica TaxID=2033802 RepID=UPI001F0C9936|nr:3-hydroxyacyl-CoA dehydrogenase NAD-binding domain-containing protein [Halomonas endophytica]